WGTSYVAPAEAGGLNGLGVKAGPYPRSGPQPSVRMKENRVRPSSPSEAPSWLPGSPSEIGGRYAATAVFLTTYGRKPNASMKNTGAVRSTVTWRWFG